MAALKWAGLVAALLPLSGGAAVIHYVQSAPGTCSPEEICTAIGVPVPLPQESLTPVAGFRSYATLIAGLQDLVLQNSDVASFQSAGKTRGNGTVERDIWSFRIGDDDGVTAEGLPEPAFLQSGTIHAREWAAPEVAAAYLERLLGNRADHSLHQYLIENVQSISIPVLNVDGFLQTQRFPERAQQSTCAEDGSPSEPRDGRLRRKNMNADAVPADEDLFTLADATFGVDANRNNNPWWGGEPGSSSDPCSLVYRGVAAQSEREVQALQAAAALGPANRLRLYIDTHSYGRTYLSANTLNTRRNNLQQQLAQRMSAAASGRYDYAASAGGGGIGSTDEYFANTYQIPAYTLEIEPRLSGLSDYGGINVSNSGFILPAAEIARVREELTAATLLGVYRQAGPPSVAAVVISDAGSAVFSAQWQPTGSTARVLQVAVRQPLQPQTTYTLWIAFNKPMRVRNADEEIAQYPGQNVALVPTLSLDGIATDGQGFSVPITAPNGQWLKTAGGTPAGYLRYADDAFAVTFQIPAGAPLTGARRLALSVSATDLSGQALDANPATVADWSSGAWSRYENADCAEGDVGGIDRSTRLVDDGTALCEANSGGGGGGGGEIAAELIAILFAGAWLRRRRLHNLSTSG